MNVLNAKRFGQQDGGLQLERKKSLMGPFQSGARFISTIRHLKPIQIAGRVYFRLVWPQPDLSPPPPASDTLAGWQRPAARNPSMTASDQFLFLNQPGELAILRWDGDDRDKLWRYNQHYFDDLNASEAELRREWHVRLIAAWIAANPPGQGTGWEPYPTSLRIVNWIKWASVNGGLMPDMEESLAVQVRWLTRRIEWHLLGNHLFANAKALIFAGLYFSGPEADRWLKKGLRIVASQVGEQFLSDGGQFELSAMYHALALEDVLDLINILRAAGRDLPVSASKLLASLSKLVSKMLHWLDVMSHPDGGIALFNDAAFHIAPGNAEIADYAGRLGFKSSGAISDGVVALKQSGYLRLALGSAVVLADVGRIGPDYLPGHSHADTLGFEMSLWRQRIFVDSGTSVYGTGAERLRQRGTAAHNTVEVGTVNSSDVWGGFRVGRRAYPKGVSTSTAPGSLVAEATHDGYRHLRCGLLHHRRWQLEPGMLTVTDSLTHSGIDAVVRFHLHPNVFASADGTGGIVLRLPDGKQVRAQANGLEIDIAPSTWHPEFGIDLPSQCLVARLKQGRSCFEFSWD